MALDQKFRMDMSSCCDEWQFCDITCTEDPLDPASCCNGYGGDNITKNDIASTRFNWILPDATTYTGLDVGYVPAHYATVQFDIEDGTAGDGVVVMIAGITLGTAIYTFSIQQVRDDLVNSINASSGETGWTAYTDDITVFITSTSSGTEYNNLTLSVLDTPGSTFTITIDDDQTAGANDEDDCYTWILPDLTSTPCEGPDYPTWPVGVYTLTMISLDEDGAEIARKTQKFLNDCLVRNCICNATRQLLTDCPCTDSDAWAKVAIMKSELDAIKQAFREGSYDCANEAIQDLKTRCEHLCLDC